MSPRRNPEFVKINAVHDKDLLNLLQQLNVMDKVNNNEFVCESCQTTLNFENIGAIYIEKDQVKMCCDLVDCISFLNKNKNEGRSQKTIDRYASNLGRFLQFLSNLSYRMQ